MIWHTLEPFLRRSVLIKGESINIRVALLRWQDTEGGIGRYQNILLASKMMFMSDNEAPDGGHYRSIVPQNVTKDICELSVTFAQGYTGESVDVGYSYHLRDYPERISVRAVDVPAGPYTIKISALVGDETVHSEIPVLILGEGEFWRLLHENIGLCHKEKKISSEIAGVISSAQEVRDNIDAHNLEKLGVRIEWDLSDLSAGQDRRYFHEPVNMWTAYQLLRLVQAQVYEQAIYGGSAEVGLAEEEGRLTLKAHLKSNTGIYERSLEVFTKTIRQLPGLDRVGIFMNPPHDIYIIAKFLIYSEALRDRDNNLPVVTIGDLRFDSELADNNMAKKIAVKG